MEHFKDNSGCSGPKKSEIFWNNSRKVQYVFAGVISLIPKTCQPNKKMPSRKLSLKYHYNDSIDVKQIEPCRPFKLVFT